MRGRKCIYHGMQKISERSFGQGSRTQCFRVSGPMVQYVSWFGIHKPTVLQRACERRLWQRTALISMWGLALNGHNADPFTLTPFLMRVPIQSFPILGIVIRANSHVLRSEPKNVVCLFVAQRAYRQRIWANPLNLSAPQCAVEETIKPNALNAMSIHLFLLPHAAIATICLLFHNPASL